MKDDLSSADTDPSQGALRGASEEGEGSATTIGSQTLVPGLNAPMGPVILPATGYSLGEVIGRGGMGEVVAARDLRIGREVALKRMRTERPTTEALHRFLREARIQARLDHPAIVPVHELGMDEHGMPYFTMKRLQGATLTKQMLDDMPQNRLLRAFVEVCLAVELAHARGVVHRDLKPSNIMLGGYGEVYVLDWGIARVIGEELASGGESGTADIDTVDQGTQTGAILGTPGYMAPEQIRGHAVTEQADIYSLGAILFEILTGESLHPRGQGAIGSTLGNAQVSPVARRADRGIAPELDAICFDCLAELPERRPTAHELAERVQRFLDGDRDVAQRRALAAELVVSARAALDSADPDARGTATRRAGRALVLDPENVEAGELVSHLVLEPPPPGKYPPGLTELLETSEREMAQKRSRKALYAYLSVFAMFPLLFVTDVENWTMVGAFYGAIATGALLSVTGAKTGEPRIVALLFVQLASVLLFTRIASPFVLTPLAICCVISLITPIKWIDQHPRVMLGWTALAVLLPFAFEWAGFLPRSWWLANDRLVIDSSMVKSTGHVESIGLVFMSFVFTMVVAWLALAINRQRRIAEHATLVQSWHLRQLLPVRRSWDTRPSVSPPAAAEPARR